MNLLHRACLRRRKVWANFEAPVSRHDLPVYDRPRHGATRRTRDVLLCAIRAVRSGGWLERHETERTRRSGHLDYRSIRAEHPQMYCRDAGHLTKGYRSHRRHHGRQHLPWRAVITSDLLHASHPAMGRLSHSAQRLLLWCQRCTSWRRRDGRGRHAGGERNFEGWCVMSHYDTSSSVQDTMAWSLPRISPNRAKKFWFWNDVPS